MDLPMEGWEGRINKDNRESSKGNWWKGRMETMEKRNIDEKMDGDNKWKKIKNNMDRRVKEN